MFTCIYAALKNKAITNLCTVEEYPLDCHLEKFALIKLLSFFKVMLIINTEREAYTFVREIIKVKLNTSNYDVHTLNGVGET